MANGLSETTIREMVKRYPAEVPECPTCDGSRMVADGWADGEYGLLPCVKECPDCCDTHPLKG